MRGSPVTKFLHAPDRVVNPETLERAIRAHGNLIEYAPLFLLLLLLAEINQSNAVILHLSGASFFVGRLMHGIGFGFLNHSPIMRIGGMALTFLGFIILLLTTASQLLGV